MIKNLGGLMALIIIPCIKLIDKILKSAWTKEK